MKKQILLTFLLFPFLAFSQDAFNETKILVDYQDLLQRNDLGELLNIYLEKTDFDSIDYVEFEQVLLFIEDPFREDFDYEYFDPTVVVDLNEYIIENKNTKREIKEEDYHLILECNNSFPVDFNEFLEDDKIVLDDSIYECFKEKYEEKYPPEDIVSYPYTDEDGDGLIDMMDREPNVSSPADLTTQLVDATSQFLVDRVKEELLLAFFDRFLSQVDQSTELTALLPNTYFLLKNNDVFQVPSMGEVWMTAFEEDLTSIPQNFQLMVQSHPDYMDLKNKSELQLFMMAGFIYDKIQDESNLIEIVESFYTNFKETDTQLIQMVGVVGVIRENLMENDYSLVSRKDFQGLFEDNEDAPLYFSALIYQQERNLFDGIKIQQFSTQLILGDLIKTNFVDFTKMAGQFLTRMKKLENSKSEFEGKKYLKDAQKEKYQEAVLEFANSVFEFLDYSVELAYFSNPEYYFSSSYFKTYRPVAQKTIQAIGAGQKKDYGQLMIYSMQMMEPLVQVRIEYLESKLVEKPSQEIKQEIKILRGVIKNFMYYGGFMVDVLSANSTQDIKGIINKYAAPVGSYRVKRQSIFSVSLSSYPGLYGGWETTTNTESENESFVTGVTAPIGLSLNWGNSFYGLKAKGHSFSVFAPIVDIGAAFSYRWSNSAGAGFPEKIKWEQIISPGVHAVWGIGNTPMALMIGAQYTPLLRKITDQNNELQQNAWRFGATISVDIPFFHFYRSNK